MNKDIYTLSDAQLRNELARCEFCEEKPCREACPANCSPADFIMAVRGGEVSDIRRAAAEILENNPFGGICGMVCPSRHCQSGCVMKGFNTPVDIPMIQATIISKAHAEKLLPDFVAEASTGKKVAVIGAGPAGMAAASYLACKGHSVKVFEAGKSAGGMCNLIPKHRLPREVLQRDIDFILSMTNVELELNRKIDNPESLLNDDFDAVCVAVGLWEPISPRIENENLAVYGTHYLADPEKSNFKGRVAVIGGGSTAADCAITAHKLGAAAVELFALETVGEMTVTPRELNELLELNIGINTRIRVKGIAASGNSINGLKVNRINLEGSVFSLASLKDIEGTEVVFKGYDHVIIAIGNRSNYVRSSNGAVFGAGDFDHGPSTVVEAVAGGKNAAAQVHAYLSGSSFAAPEVKSRSQETVVGFNAHPVSLETDFFGTRIINPFLLSAAPPSDGLEEMTRAYEAGWAGGVLKTAFKKTDIHIPGEYMFHFNRDTYANCDNVSGHSLERVCEEVSQLVKQWPDRLTIISTGGPVSGNDEADKLGWQENTRMAERAGAKAVEYSLSCPQGGDGTEGDIVSQNAALTAKIIGWIMEVSDPSVPKLFKLTPAVTSIVAIVNAIKEVLDRYPSKKAGITLANTFPSLAFRKGEKKEWEEGFVVGMSGEGVKNISYLSLANVINSGVYVSGNGGVMDYKGAGDFLALGCGTVQLCTLVMKSGYGIIDELTSGLSQLMAQRGIENTAKLIGIAGPSPIRDFMDITPVKKISSVDKELCEHCGNCTRCPYLAITLDDDRNPVIAADHCIGCSICAQKCFAGALSMRTRTDEEMKQLKED
ncbi:MAG: dihydropyrimidine dehydrogenase [Candidatus Wallbacteria bacterium HGW-Wallbacteria-1]|uniref:dihydrouracil dehydrogenase (NAD(+)) n=1 Tax=Candidatus Wallbacteria bacterium HGW-Wallbacteria-1 TaxID=2013854 RepID=A0A2N1PRY8_9BACT|nr:MAG: dihydropyrimidine dehydrogenase [Candidatus Wallbacteria bacterium HGW-Wallbacteria-1]